MKPLARFIMGGYSQAAVVAAGFALLSMLVPLLGLISAASVGLFTLRGGVQRGLILCVLATLGAGVFCVLTFGSPWPALGILLVLWVPLWGLATVLRFSRSLDMTVHIAGAVGLLLVLLVYAISGDPVSGWSQLLEPLRQTLVTDGALEPDTSEALFTELARWMTGTLAAALVLQGLASLFIARWWQAALFNPGGFGLEFRGLRLHRLVGVATLALVAALGFAKGPGLIADLLLVLGVLLALQGLAVAHELHRLTSAHLGWLVGLYLLLVLLMPQTAVLLACVGLVDVWVDFRARLAQRLSE